MWLDEYNTGFLIIDQQHKKLFDATSILYSRIQENKYCSNDIIKTLFVELREYISEHFSLEEELMSINKYKNATKHKEEHKFFIKKIEEIYQEISNGRIDKIIDLYDFLKHWFIRHIQTTDKIMINCIMIDCIM